MRTASISLAIVFAAVFPDTHAFEPLERPVDEMAYHVRFRAPAGGPAPVVLRWNDSLRVEADIPGRGADDPLLGAEIPYRYYVGDSLVCSGHAGCVYASSQAAVSLVLRVWPEGAAVEIGASDAVASIPVSFDRTKPHGLDYDNPSDLQVLRNSLYIEELPEPEYAPFADIESLMEAVAASPSPVSGLWAYLDRDNDRTLAVPGGFYTLAAVRDADGSYMLVYLDGARERAESWTPMRIKGRLRPTRFENHFDLDWFDADGRHASNENFADIDAVAGIMTLHFPLLRTTLRFSAR